MLPSLSTACCHLLPNAASAASLLHQAVFVGTYHFITSTLDAVEGLAQRPGQVHFLCYLQPSPGMCMMGIFYQNAIKAADDTEPAGTEPFLPLQGVVQAAWTATTAAGNRGLKQAQQLWLAYTGQGNDMEGPRRCLW